MASPIATAWVEIVPEMSGFSRQLRQELGSATGQIEQSNRSLFGNVGRVAGTAVAGVGLAVAGVAATVAGIAIRGGLDRALNIQNARAQLTGLGYDAESVAGIMQDATAAVTGTAFSMDQAASLAGTALAAGIEPGEDLTRVLSLVADAATLAQTDMASMGSIFNKVAASNKLQMDTINQLQDAGIPILQYVAAEMGVTAEEAARMASAGEINFETFANAMEENLGGAALAAGDTFQGALANVRTALANLTDDLWLPIIDELAPVLQNVQGLISDVGKEFADEIPAWTSGVGTAASSVDGLITRIREAIAEGDSLGSSITDALGATPGGAILLGVLESLGEAFADIRDALVASGVPEALQDVGRELGGALADALIEIGPQLPGIVTAFADLAIALVPLLPAVVDLVIALLPLVDALVDLAAEDLIPVVTEALEVLTPAVSEFVEALALVPGLGDDLVELFDALRDGDAREQAEALDTLTESAHDYFDEVEDFVRIIGGQDLVDFWRWFIPPEDLSDSDNVFGGLRDALWDVIEAGQSVGGFLSETLTPAFVEIRDAVQDSFLKIQDAVNVFVDNFTIGGVSIGEILDRVKNGFLGLPQFASDAWASVQQAFFNARVQVGVAVGQIVTGLAGVWNTIKSILPAPVIAGIDQVLGFFRALPASIGGIVAGSQGSFLSIGQSIVSGIAQGIRNGASGIANAIVNAVTGGAQAGRAAAEVNSPSKLYARLLGEPLIEGIAYGIDTNAHLVDEALARTVSSATSVRAFDSNVTYGNLRSSDSVQVVQNIDMTDMDPSRVERAAALRFEEVLRRGPRP